MYPLVTQLHFARKSFLRCLEGVNAEDALKRLGPMNCISWTVGHLANQENRYWVRLAQGLELQPGLNDLVGYHKPASTPPLDEMWAAWHEITTAADGFLAELTPEQIHQHFEWKGEPTAEDVGTLLMRNIYHYWFHTGEAYAVRQMLGHPDLPEFVGDLSGVRFD